MTDKPKVKDSRLYIRVESNHKKRIETAAGGKKKVSKYVLDVVDADLNRRTDDNSK